ncbi:MAG TPA: tRNA lysidine(34) synthetase TilS [Burkholderiaceae bacterium]|nr:tRNA lysidine(34) synthetase TilS [Burkholderiaceae bacterium]
MIAFSGGLDSTVLLHAAAAAAGAQRLLAVHVHHRLQAAADGWPAHCERIAREAGAAYHCVRLGTRRRGNVEDWARRQRYAALLEAARRFGAAAVLTAHHADDQAETVLLQLGRGAGVDGLSAVAQASTLEGTLLLRPLLALQRVDLKRYAQATRLEWIDDPTNSDLNRRRNLLRERVMPALEHAIPGFALKASEAARHLQQVRELLDEVAAADLGAAQRELAAQRQLDRRAIAALSPARQALVLRRWLAALGLPMPAQARLAQMLDQLVRGQGAYGRVEHHGWTLRRYRDRIEAVAPHALSAATDLPQPPSRRGRGRADPALPQTGSIRLRWRGETEIALGGDAGRLRFTPARGPDAVNAEWLRNQDLELVAPRATLSLRTRPRGRSRTLKNLHQEAGVPAWLRPAFPVLQVGGQVLYAAPFGADHGAHWPRQPPAVAIEWVPPTADDPRRAWLAAAAV